MTFHDNDYLFANHYAPLTKILYFLKARPESIADLSLQYFRRWAEGRWYVGADRVLGDLEELIRGLPPLRRAATRYLVVPTRSDWTAMFSNDVGGMEQSLPSLLGEEMHCEYLRVLDAPGVDEVRNAPTSMPSRMFGYEANMGQKTSASRYVELLLESGWEFEERGTPLAGEDTSVYRARRMRDRFPHAQLRVLCSLVGAQPFDYDFYAPAPEGTIRLIKELPLLSGDPISLEQAQAGRLG